MANNEPTQNINAFLGIHNKEQSSRLPTGALVSAENVDIDNTGCVVLREGYSSALNLTSVTSAFSTQDERRAFVIDNGELKLIKHDLSESVLSGGFASDYIHWLEISDFILLSTGHVIDKDNQVSSWKIPNPPQPNVSIVNGSLSAGQYQVVITYTDSIGREGGASDVLSFDLPNDSGLDVSPIYDGYSINVYISDKNHTELFLYGRYSDGLPVTITSVEGLAFPIDGTQLKAYPCPAAEHMAHFNSSLYCAVFSGGITTLFHSKPFWWNLFDLQNDYIQIEGKVTMLHGHAQGLIIATDKAIYVYTIEDALVKMADYGTPNGKPYTVDDEGNVFIHSNQGLCVALPFKNLTEEKVSLPAGEHCFTELMEKNGTQKVVVLTDGNGNADNKLAS